MLMLNCEIMYVNLKLYIAGKVGAYTLNTYCIASNYGSGAYFFLATMQDWRLLIEVLNQSFAGDEF